MKVAEIRPDGTVVVLMDDNRMFPATAPEGHKLKAGDSIKLAEGKMDDHGVPVDAKILLPK